ncbi:uncharacterized protein BDZ99DRAFT_382177 [Mytilinidion resinicola]|uniref:Zn(2)-C6 fungal-type domain-containing protein n=1 Tax=Mytilinidion resinicola TaxID=574789 RepID=A0A6A6YWY4_9PEZI|nr:uncharacterized protein BDZ99DRAFT_382177 [Mytilinidion resinicola]KAF2813280.1 hypothetical protein BDZ99DRAFT_382177 [Mytilinidion resinicola]
MVDSTNSSIQSRPYRSHRVPACRRCRARKIRCHIDIPSQPCLACRQRRLNCQYAEPQTQTVPDEDASKRADRCSKRPRLSNADEIENTTPEHSAPTLPKVSVNSSEKSSIIVGPTVAEDVHILQQHISHHRPGQNQSEFYQSMSHDIDHPIFYLSVPRCRAGLPPPNAGKHQLEIIEQILGTYRHEVIALYFEFVHPHFPVLDDETCSLLQDQQIGKVSQALLCCVYAIASPNWQRSKSLKTYPGPDTHFLWNTSVCALLDDFISPSLETISTSVLDLIGRPSETIVGNSTLCGRTVALAQTFGLHRNPSNWNIRNDEKTTRIRLWWGVLINDYWSSISYGFPPHISKSFYDVPIPLVTSLVPAKATLPQRHASACFIHLCYLTELLGDILPLVYALRPNPGELSLSVDRLKVVLDKLESKLPDRLPISGRPGSSNLWFCFFSMKLLLSRLALRADVLVGNTGDPDSEHDRLHELRMSSSAVVEFVLDLKKRHFQDFWLPYTAHMLVLATMVSLRCTVETKEADVRNASISRLKQLMAYIQHARDDYDWDIADVCLERCSGPIIKMASLTTQEAQTASGSAISTSIEAGLEDAQLNALDAGSSLLFSDLLDPAAFDFPLEALWDTPSGLPISRMIRMPHHGNPYIRLPLHEEPLHIFSTPNKREVWHFRQPVNSCSYPRQRQQGLRRLESYALPPVSINMFKPHRQWQESVRISMAKHCINRNSLMHWK